MAWGYLPLAVYAIRVTFAWKGRTPPPPMLLDPQQSPNLLRLAASVLPGVTVL